MTVLDGARESWCSGGMKVGCPHCAHKFDVPESYAGATVHCPGCREELAVGPSPAVTRDRVAPPWPGKACRLCRGKVASGAYECPHCGAELKSRYGLSFLLAVAFGTLLGGILWVVLIWVLISGGSGGS